MDGFAPEDTAVLSQLVDAEAPESQLAAARIAGTDDYRIDWTINDDNGGSGVRHVTLYVAETGGGYRIRSEEHTSALQSLMRISYAVFCLQKNNTDNIQKLI